MLTAISHFDRSSVRTPSTTSAGNQRGVTAPPSASVSAPSDRRFKLLILELHRLLHCMENDSHGNDVNENGVFYYDMPWQCLERRMELLQSIWQQIQQSFHEYLEQNDISMVGTSSGLEENPTIMTPRWYQEYEQRVYLASQKAHEAMHALQRQEKEEIFNTSQVFLLQQEQEEEPPQPQPGPNLIEQIFFPDDKKKQEEEEMDDDNNNEDPFDIPVERDLIGQPMPNDASDEHRSSAAAPTNQNAFNNNNGNNMDIAAFQKAQREQIEQAISQMAEQLKNETERIHSTLKDQTQGLLGEMEDIAAENVEKVTEVTEDVTAHVQKGWIRTWGTWTLLILVASLFLFSLSVIYMIPKYNSPPQQHQPPSQLCRMVDGKEECLDINSWLTGKKETEQEQQQKDPPVQEIDIGGDPGGEPSDDLKGVEAAECELEMDGTCKKEDPQLSDLERDLQHDLQLKLQQQREEEQKREEERQQQERERIRKEEARQKQEQEEQQRAAEQRQREFEEERKRQVQRQQHEQSSGGNDQARDGQEGNQGDALTEEEERAKMKEILLKERADRERLNLLRQMQEQGGGEQNLEQIHAEREAMRKEREEQLVRRDELRQRELQQLEQQRQQREMTQEQPAIQAETQEQAQEQAQEHKGQHEHQTIEEDEAPVQQEEEISEEERRKREFWAQQKAKQEEAARKKEQEQLERERLRQEKERAKIAGAAAQEQAKVEKQHEAQVKGFGSFTSGDSAFVEPKGFEAFGADSVYRPRGFKEQNKQAGWNADLPMGFGSFLREEDNAPPGFGGGAFGGAGADAAKAKQENSKQGGAETPPEPEFRGRPFAPRDIRRAASSGNAAELADYLDQRPGWVDKKDKNDWTALHLAIRGGHLNTVEALIAAGADVNGRTAYDQTPLSIALERVGEEHPVTVLLRNHGANL